MPDRDSDEGFNNSGEAFQADLDAILEHDWGIKEEDEKED